MYVFVRKHIASKFLDNLAKKEKNNLITRKEEEKTIMNFYVTKTYPQKSVKLFYQSSRIF